MLGLRNRAKMRPAAIEVAWDAVDFEGLWAFFDGPERLQRGRYIAGHGAVARGGIGWASWAEEGTGWR